MRRLLFILKLLALAPVFALSMGEAAPRMHTVHAGQRLGSIAKRYNVSAEALCHANRIEKCSVIRPGQKLLIPDRSDKDGSATRRLVDQGHMGANARSPSPKNSSPPRQKSKQDSRRPQPRGLQTHKVYAGQRLGSIAKRYRISVDALCNANDITPKSPIHPGQELLIPSRDDKDGSETRLLASRKPQGNESASVSSAKRRSKNRTATWKPYSKPPWRRGYVHVIGHHASWKGYLIGPGGRVLPAARRAISRVLAWPHRDKLMATQLLKLLGNASDEFGGRPLRIVSGFRSRSFARESRHKHGKAVDFRVVGVPNEALRDYLRSLGNVGVGYYPNSTFVHFDVRTTPTYWIDVSGPGQAPRYRHISSKPRAHR